MPQWSPNACLCASQEMVVALLSYPEEGGKAVLRMWEGYKCRYLENFKFRLGPFLPGLKEASVGFYWDLHLSG